MCADDVRSRRRRIDWGRKEIIARENLTVMGVVARYVAAYAKIDKMFWWDKDMACGPIVEQGTHFGNPVLGMEPNCSRFVPLFWWGG
jgi:hypothetical protein